MAAPTWLASPSRQVLPDGWGWCEKMDSVRVEMWARGEITSPPGSHGAKYTFVFLDINYSIVEFFFEFWLGGVELVSPVRDGELRV